MQGKGCGGSIGRAAARGLSARSAQAWLCSAWLCGERQNLWQTPCTLFAMCMSVQRRQHRKDESGFDALAANVTDLND